MSTLWKSAARSGLFCLSPAQGKIIRSSKCEVTAKSQAKNLVLICAQFSLAYSLWKWTGSSDWLLSIITRKCSTFSLKRGVKCELSYFGIWLWWAMMATLVPCSGTGNLVRYSGQKDDNLGERELSPTTIFWPWQRTKKRLLLAVHFLWSKGHVLWPFDSIVMQLHSCFRLYLTLCYERPINN